MIGLQVSFTSDTCINLADLGLYYLNTRYYDPVIGRFINADTTDVLTANPKALTDKNLYAYCDNNPMMRKDENGEFWFISIGMAIGAVANIAATMVAAQVTGQKCDGLDILVAGVSDACMAIPGAAQWVGLGNAAYAGVNPNTSKNNTKISTAKSVSRSSTKHNYNTKKKSKCSAMGRGCSTDYFLYLYNGGTAF